MRIRLLLCLLLLASPAWAQKSKSVLSSEVTSSFPDNSTGAITPAIVRGVLGDFLSSWQQYAAVNAQVGTTYTVQASDYGQLLTLDNVGAVAVTLPQALAPSFYPFNFFVSNLGAGSVTVTPTGSTINGASSFVVTQNQSVWIISDGTNYQVFRGFGSGVVQAGSAGQLAYFPTSAASVSGVTLGGDCTFTAPNITCLKTNGTLFGTAATQSTGTSGTTLPFLNGANSWSGAQRGVPVNVAISGTTFTPNFNTGQNFEIDLISTSCSCTVANPSTSLVAGQSGVIEIHQPATTSATIGTWGSAYQYVGGTGSIVLSTVSATVDYVSYYVNAAATGIVLGTVVKAPSH